MRRFLGNYLQFVNSRGIARRPIKQLLLLIFVFALSINTQAQISGASSVCVSATTTLSATPPGGTWTSSLTSVATVGSSSGIVTGISTGVATISYTIGPATSTQVISVNPLPSVFSVTGGGSYCAGGLGLHIGVNSSTTGINYQLYNGPSMVGSALTGTGGALDFGPQTAAGTYTVLATNLTTGCSVTMSGSASITINPLPSAISGPTAYCPGGTGTLSSTAGGVWTSSTPSVATIGSASGAVSAIAPGTTIITYTFSSTGCATTATVTVTSSSGAISAPSTVCLGSTVTLTDAVPGGTWSSSATAVATIGSLTGVLTGAGVGVTTINYSLGTLGCSSITTVSVVTGPASITGATYACVGSTTSLSDATGGGTWSSSPTTVAAISGTGAVLGVSPGVATISYTQGGCSRTLNITVNATPAAIGGPTIVCVGNTLALTDAVSGGLWSTISPAISVGSSSGIVTAISASTTATVDYSIGGCFTSVTLTVVPVPVPISAPTDVCVGSTATLTDATPGGVWASSGPSSASIGSTTGVVTGLSSGTVIISYTTGCTVVTPLVIDPITPIIGVPVTCVGQTVHLTDGTLGGSWTSSDTTIAKVNGGGVVTGIAAGIATIDYILSTGCMTSIVATIDPLPNPIGGPSSVCAGMAITLTETSSGGAWSSSNPGVASVSSTGIVSGASFGVTTITYAFSSSTGCITTKTISVNALAPAIAGPSNVCLGSTISLTDAGTGTWTSSNPAIGSIDASGTVYGLALGTTTITLTLSTTCYATTPVTVINPPSAISGADSICVSSTTLFSDPSGIGSWSIGSIGVAIVGSSSGVVTGTGAGTAIVTFTASPGCFATRPVTVNALPGIIAGILNICPGTTSTLTDPTPGGVWISGTPAVATIGSLTGLVNGLIPGTTLISYTNSLGCAATRAFTVSSGPMPISGYSSICVGTSAAFGDATPGGTFSSSAPAIANATPSGTITGMAVGTAMITYSTGTICPVTFPVTVTTLPAPITGSNVVCVGSTTGLTDLVSTGSWSSSNTAIATVGSSSGVVSGVSASPVTITYTIGPACNTTLNMTVNPVPLPVTGPDSVCQTQAVTLSDATPAGAWSSLNPAIGTVDAGGNVTGLLPGVVNIAYTNSFNCSAFDPVTVDAMPSAIIGSYYSCLGNTSILSDTVVGGTWTSFSPAIASIGSSSGIVTGNALGTATIVYSTSSGCVVSAVITVDPLPAAYTVTGGGSHCAGDTGVHIGLSNSDMGNNYLLYLGSTAVGTFPGTGSALDFGLQTLAGTYTVKSINTTTGCISTMTGSAVVTVVPSVVPSVGIAASPRDTVCSGSAATFTPIPVNGGPTPTYRWNVNGLPVSITSSYTYVPANGDVVSVIMTSDIVCPIPNPVSDSIVMTVLPFEHPAVSIYASPGDTVCQGTVVTLHAVPTYGGPSPSYTWMRNGAPAIGGGTYAFVPNDGDVMTCAITSNYLCLLAGTDTSAPLVMKVDTPAIPFVYIGASPSSIILKGQSDTLTAYVSNAVAPTFQWYMNDSLIAGATTSTYVNTFTSYANDSITCVVTTNGACRLTTFQWIFVRVIDGISQLSAFGDINLLPNPNKGEFVVKGSISTFTDQDVYLEMTDMLGRVVYTDEILAQNGKLNKRIQLDGSMPPGMYVVSLRYSGDQKVFHVVVEQ